MAQPDRFMRLPPELRLKIYSELLDPPKRSRFLLCFFRGRIEEMRIYTAILRTNKQIYVEAMPVLYASKTPCEIDIVFGRAIERIGTNDAKVYGDVGRFLQHVGDGAAVEAVGGPEYTCKCLSPRVLQRLHNVAIHLSQAKLVERASTVRAQSCTRELLMETLMVLSEDPDPAGKQKTLIVQFDQLGDEDFPLHQRPGRVPDTELQKIEGLPEALEAVQAKRKLVMCGIFKHEWMPVDMEDRL